MATSFTLTSLKNAIQGHTEDFGTKFAANLDMIIQLAEDSIVRDLPLSVFDSTSSVSFVQGNQEVDKPADTLAIHELYYTSAGTRIALEPKSYSYCMDYATSSAEGLPKFYAQDYSPTKIYIAPAPNAAFSATVFMSKRPAGLVTDTGGTFISKNIGDLLLAACMVAAERFNISNEQVTMWDAEYTRLLASARVDFSHILRRGYAPLAPQPVAVDKKER